jgi:hypothetical protein
MKAYPRSVHHFVHQTRALLVSTVEPLRLSIMIIRGIEAIKYAVTPSF